MWHPNLRHCFSETAKARKAVNTLSPHSTYCHWQESKHVNSRRSELESDSLFITLQEVSDWWTHNIFFWYAWGIFYWCGHGNQSLVFCTYLVSEVCRPWAYWPYKLCRDLDWSRASKVYPIAQAYEETYSRDLIRYCLILTLITSIAVEHF